MVRETEVSREFRMKRNNLAMKLVTFLRLYLMGYYRGADLYKIFVTFPGSLNYELFVFRYYLEIITALFARYP